MRGRTPLPLPRPYIRVQQGPIPSGPQGIKEEEKKRRKKCKRSVQGLRPFSSPAALPAVSPSKAASPSRLSRREHKLRPRRANRRQPLPSKPRGASARRQARTARTHRSHHPPSLPTPPPLPRPHPRKTRARPPGTRSRTTSCRATSRRWKSSRTRCLSASSTQRCSSPQPSRRILYSVISVCLPEPRGRE